jgi:hypothetical protein
VIEKEMAGYTALAAQDKLGNASSNKPSKEEKTTLPDPKAL